MSSLVTFVNSIRGARKSLLTKGSRILYVIGNDSCDLDSCTSSILTAFFCTSRVSEGNDLGLSVKPDVVIPVLNIPRDDLKLRRDIVYLLQDIGINYNSLLFLEDVEKDKNSYLFLVDHNRVTPSLNKVFSDDQVVGIIDHHDNENLYLDSIGNGPRIVKKAGSCSSLVLNYWKTKVKQDIFNDEPLVKFALASLLIDTSNMKSKVEDADTENYNFLAPKADFDIKELFKTLKRAKSDLEGFSGSDIIRKDYKRFEQPDGSLAIGISSVGKSLQWIYNQAPDFDKDCQLWAQDQGLSVYACLSSFKDPTTGNHRREIAIWSKDESIRKLAVDKFQNISATVLDLKPKNSSEASIFSRCGLAIFDQIQDRATRKQVAPLLRSAVHGIQLQDL